MARTKKNTAKEPVRLRTKDLANGNKSLYLDIYVNGARSYEFLKLYLVPETSAAAKVANKNTMQAANAIKARRILDIANGMAGIKKAADTDLTLISWMEQMRDAAKAKETGKAMEVAAQHVQRYKPNVKLVHVDKAFIKGFISYLEKCTSKWGKPISNNTRVCYLRNLTTAIRAAMRQGLITGDPLAGIAAADKPHIKDTGRDYLTVEEVKAMAEGKCGNEQVKRAFMFGCFCGLRLSDIRNLTWGQISKDGQMWHADVTMQKTGGRIILPLSQEAIKWLPTRAGAMDYENVFDLPYTSSVERTINKWAQVSGIKKHVTFHVSRHTFATLSLTAGADLYTTSKLLGHTNVSTTQIYAKIIDSKKDEAVNAVSSLFG